MEQFISIIAFILVIASVVFTFKPNWLDKRLKRKHTIIAAVLFFIVMATAAGQAGVNPAGDTSVASTTPKTSTTAKTVATPKFDWKTADLTPDNVKEALKDVKGAGIVPAENVIIKDGNVEVDATIKDYWNEKDLLQDVSWTMVADCKTLFANPNVKNVALSVSTTFEDAYGNDNNDIAANIMWSRETSSKVNYDNFTSMNEVDYTSAFTIADDYMIHPAIFKALKDADKAKLQK